jgi:integrase
MRRGQHPQPFWRAARGCFYVQIGNKQVRLDPDRDAAYELYHKLMARRVEEPLEARPASGQSVVQVLDAFLDWVKANKAEKTYVWHKNHIQKFCDGIPKTLTIDQLKPLHLTRIMDARAWSPSTKNGFGRSIQRAIRWANRQGLIDRNPIAFVDKPGCEAREVVVSPEEFAKLLASARDQAFHDLLVTAWETGARAQEILKVEARHVDLANNRWVFKIRESKGKRRVRTVFLSEKAAEITRRLAAKYPAGKLFRNEDGEPWQKDTINQRFSRRKNLMGQKLCLTHIRHSFATRMLLAGVDALTVATWLGHADTSMLSRVYGHLTQNPDYLHERLRQASSGENPVAAIAEKVKVAKGDT